MHTPGVLAIGLVFLVLGLAAATGCFFWKRSSEKKAGWWSSVAEVDITTALDAGDGIAVAVPGVTVAPATPAGPLLTDPVNGDECCWWRETVTEHWEERVRVTQSSQDKTSGPDYRWEDRDNQLSERISGVPFTLQGEGVITITLADLEIDEDLLQSRATRDREGDGPMPTTAGGIAGALVEGLVRGTDDRRNEYTETRIRTLPPGLTVVAVGRMSGASLVADEEHKLQVIKGTVEERLGKSQKSAGRATFGLRAGIGLFGLGVLLSVAGAIVG